MDKIKSLLEIQNPLIDFSAESVFKKIGAINHLLYGVEPKMYVGKQKDAEVRSCDEKYGSHLNLGDDVYDKENSEFGTGEE